MHRPSQQPPPILVFDGECGFCTASVLWLRRRLKRPVELVPWQELAATGGLTGVRLDRDDVRRWAWWIEDGRRWRGHRAGGRALLACRGAWPALGALLLLPAPLSWPAALGYRLVARFRGRLPGVTPACRRDRWPPDS